MAGRRRRPESAYERRIRRYLEAHPGATRQEARGHRPPQGSSEYRERVLRARRAHPGISRRAAGGHGSADERELARLLRLIRSQPRDVQVAFTSLGRRKDGTYERGRFDVLYIGAGGEPESEVFVIDASTLDPRMDEVADAISTYIGQGFLGWGS